MTADPSAPAVDEIAEAEQLGREILTRYGCPGPVSPAGARCAALLQRFLRGFHHWPNAKGPEGVDWSHPYTVAVTFGYGEAFATFDDDALTRLVLLAHELAIRVTVEAGGVQRLRVRLHPRPRAGDVSGQHPTIEEAVERFRR